MEHLADILRDYGYWLIFAAVFTDFLGAPLPSFLLLLGAGALAHSSELSVAAISLFAALAALMGDLILYHLGGLKGETALHSVCRVTSDTRQCVRRTESFFSHFGVAALFAAKVAPGLKVVALPMAGVLGMPMRKFLFYDGLGALTWAASFTGVGYLCRAQIQQIGQAIEQSTMTVMIGLGLLVLAYVVGQFMARRWVLARRPRAAWPPPNHP